MAWHLALAASLALFAQPSSVLAAQGESLDPPLWMGIPFALLLLAIAVLPLCTGHFWHSNRNKALVVAGLALPVALYLLFTGPEVGPEHHHLSAAPLGAQTPEFLKTMIARSGTQELWHGLAEYVSFIVVLGALYTVAGGIALHGHLLATPLRNTAFLAAGAVLANVIGTTGASMLLIRPLLQINRERQHSQHLPVFFIFVVSNLGGLLTALGDPPLFLGFLNGVDFLWTLSLWPHWLVANGAVLTVFCLWDTAAYRRETPAALARDRAEAEPLRIRGLVNFVFLGGIVAAAMLQSEHLSGLIQAWLTAIYPVPSLHLSQRASVSLMLGMAVCSLLATQRGVRQANAFSWGAMIEVAILFVGIFVTMVPALAWLGHHGPELGVTEPWEYFWLTGGLSSFLDNAPTYMTLATLAAGGENLGALTKTKPLILQAISCGSVFMGANTYIGNGPNFMVKAIADEAGYRMPSFFGYMVYSATILLPVFVLVTFCFFR